MWWAWCREVSSKWSVVKQIIRLQVPTGSRAHTGVRIFISALCFHKMGIGFDHMALPRFAWAPSSYQVTVYPSYGQTENLPALLLCIKKQRICFSQSLLGKNIRENRIISPKGSFWSRGIRNALTKVKGLILRGEIHKTGDSGGYYCPAPLLSDVAWQG